MCIHSIVFGSKQWCDCFTELTACVFVTTLFLLFHCQALLLFLLIMKHPEMTDCLLLLDSNISLCEIFWVSTNWKWSRTVYSLDNALNNYMTTYDIQLNNLSMFLLLLLRPPPVSLASYT